jgi:hypothetical protein
MNTKKNTTIIYLTNSQIGEKSQAEENILEELRKNKNGLPVISVSRYPISLGKNILIPEDAPLCPSSSLRQLLTGLLAAKTDYAILAKSDCLYPPEYFSFAPSDLDNFYHYSNIWVMGSKYWQKGYSEVAVIGGRKHWIEVIQEALKGHRGWKPFESPAPVVALGLHSWTSENPVIIVRTNNNIRFPSVQRNVLPKTNLPFWGIVSDLKNKLELQ